MFRKSLVAALILFFAHTAVVAGQSIRVGYMNPQEVLSQIPERADIENKLNSFIEQRRGELQEKSAEFQEAVAEYQQNSASLSEEQQAQREEELAAMEAELVKVQQNIRQQIQQRRAELMAPIYNRMDKAIATVAEGMNLDFVLNEATGVGENIIYYAAQEQLDITQEVLNQMNTESN
ncbi:MAG: OmpH family outer membrane protein [Balneolaceae bacterium]|nr:OmpH family outer membrane protein [Balneolaceae bacterium]